MSFDAGSITGSLKFDISEFTSSILSAQSIAGIFPSVVTSYLVNPLLGFVETVKEAGRAILDLGFSVSKTQTEEAMTRPMRLFSIWEVARHWLPWGLRWELSSILPAT